MPATQTTSAKKLSAYREKRDFTKTPEPIGDKATLKRAATPPGTSTKRKPGRRKLRFCVQKHLASHLHYDLRLEHAGVLLSWAVPKGPSLRPSDKRLAMKVEDHPIDYLEFEGVIPSGYGAGIVMLWDTGEWEAESPDIEQALVRGELKFHLNGTKLKGSWVLVRTRRHGQQEIGRAWLLIKHRDEWSGEIEISEVAPTSVNSARDFAAILAADDTNVWKSHRLAVSGPTGAMLNKIIKSAARLKSARKPLDGPKRLRQARTSLQR